MLLAAALLAILRRIRDGSVRAEGSVGATRKMPHDAVWWEGRCAGLRVKKEICRRVPKGKDIG